MPTHRRSYIKTKSSLTCSVVVSRARFLSVVCERWATCSPLVIAVSLSAAAFGFIGVVCNAFKSFAISSFFVNFFNNNNQIAFSFSMEVYISAKVGTILLYQSCKSNAKKKIEG